jgi:lysophospholipase L1-like esterase
MRNIFFFLATMIISGAAMAQTWDSTYRPGSFALKVELFKSFPHSEKDIVFLGNSITAGVDWNELLGNHKVHNRGISGDITFGVLERLDEVIDGHPARVFILIGINDISRNVPDSFIVDNYRKMIRRIKEGSPSTKIYFHTLMPVNNEFTQFKNHYNKDQHILFVNEELKKLAQKENITLIDLYPHFQGKDGKMDKKYTVDGLHINAAGYKLWAEILKKGRYLKKKK